MKILNEEHFEKVKRYAESIGDTSFRHCLDRLESWEKNPDHPSEISLYYDHAPYSFGFTQRYPDGRTGIVGGLPLLAVAAIMLWDMRRREKAGTLRMPEAGLPDGVRRTRR